MAPKSHRALKGKSVKLPLSDYAEAMEIGLVGVASFYLAFAGPAALDWVPVSFRARCLAISADGVGYERTDGLALPRDRRAAPMWQPAMRAHPTLASHGTGVSARRPVSRTRLAPSHRSIDPFFVRQTELGAT